MFKNLKLSDVFTIIFLLIVSCLFIYYCVNIGERKKIFIQSFSIQVYFENKALKCSSQSPEWLKKILKDVNLTHRAPNNQIAYISPQGQLYHCESGYLGVPLFSKKVNAETRFRYASVSKLWTSDAILDLVKQKKMTLDGQALYLLPKIQKPNDLRVEQIRVKDLLLHRGGFNRTGLMGDEMFRSGDKPFCPTALENLSHIQLAFDPNTAFSYSNLGYCLLGEIIARQKNKSYKNFVQQEYALEKDNIRFLENRRFEDEAKYRYIETGLTGYGNIYTAFDYPALASSAGLSGSAKALAQQVKKMVHKPEPNILSQPDLLCNIYKLRNCYGYAMFPYQKDKQSLKVYFRDGVLLGASSLVVVDDHGGILTLLSSGQAEHGRREYDQTKMKVYEALTRWYQ